MLCVRLVQRMQLAKVRLPRPLPPAMLLPPAPASARGPGRGATAVNGTVGFSDASGFAGLEILHSAVWR